MKPLFLICPILLLQSNSMARQKLFIPFIFHYCLDDANFLINPFFISSLLTEVH